VASLGLFKGLEYYLPSLRTPPSGESDHSSCRRSAFSVRLIKEGDETVERMYYTDTEKDKQEWVKAFTDVKNLLSQRQKSLKDFEMLKVLGAGHFGKVVLCREKSTGHPYAMKLIKKANISGRKELQHTLDEKQFLQKLVHPFLVHMKYSFQTPDKLCFVTEFLSGGDLFHFVHVAGHLSEKETRFYAAEVICAVGFLHHNHIVHRDIKLENILIDKDGHVQLVDLGLSKELYGSEKTRTFCGTRECMAPEVLDNGLYGMSVDWWGIGIIMYEMLCGRLPFRDDSVQGLLRQIMTTETVTFPETTIGDEAADVINKLLRKDARIRLGCGAADVKEVMEHPFFRDINWNDVAAKKLTPPFVPDLASDVDAHYFDDNFVKAPLETTSSDESDTHLTSLERSKFEKISDYTE
jgi:RAC serine/threonine-protein kinase